jgi:hypothetical protein
MGIAFASNVPANQQAILNRWLDEAAKSTK